MSVVDFQDRRATAERVSAGSPARATPEDRLPLIALAVLLAIGCGWIFSLPVFPSQDGPIHVYYAVVTRSLMSGERTFADGFRVAHALPPYSLHSYVLMFLLRWMSGAAAEKALACICVISVALGFLYFARQLGPRGALISVFAVPFFLHRYLFFGFYGYSIGLGMALLAMGIWSRSDRFRWPRRAAFVVVALAASFTHPVPYGLLLAYCVSDVVIGFALWKYSGAPQDAPLQFAHPRASDLFTLLLAGLALAYIAAYAHSGALWTMYSRAELSDNLRRLADVLQMLTVAPLKAGVYQAVLRAVFLLLLALAIWQGWKDFAARRFTRAHLALAWGLLVLFSLPLLPGQVNGSFLFADRPAIWSVLLMMAAASAIDLTPRAAYVALAAACAAALFALLVLNLHVGFIARQTDVSGRAASATPGVHVLVANHYELPPDLTWDPYVLAGVRLVEQENGILVASPFMDLQIMMLQPTEAQKAQDKLVAEPGRLVEDLRRHGIIVVTRCNQLRPDAGPAWLRHAYAGWNVSSYSCFDMLRPRP